MARGTVSSKTNNSWKHLGEHKQFQLLGYVILENHLHLIARCPELSRAMQSFKSYTARQILAYLEEQGAQTLLDQFARLKLSHKKDSEQIRTDKVMWQKLEYVHYNPVNRGYVDDPLHWRYSSARNYARPPGLIDIVTDWV